MNDVLLQTSMMQSSLLETPQADESTESPLSRLAAARCSRSTSGSSSTSPVIKPLTPEAKVTSSAEEPAAMEVSPIVVTPGEAETSEPAKGSGQGVDDVAAKEGESKEVVKIKTEPHTPVIIKTPIDLEAEIAPAEAMDAPADTEVPCEIKPIVITPIESSELTSENSPTELNDGPLEASTPKPLPAQSRLTPPPTGESSVSGTEVSTVVTKVEEGPTAMEISAGNSEEKTSDNVPADSSAEAATGVNEGPPGSDGVAAEELGKKTDAADGVSAKGKGKTKGGKTKSGRLKQPKIIPLSPQVSPQAQIKLESPASPEPEAKPVQNKDLEQIEPIASPEKSQSPKPSSPALAVGDTKANPPSPIPIVNKPDEPSEKPSSPVRTPGTPPPPSTFRERSSSIESSGSAEQERTSQRTWREPSEERAEPIGVLCSQPIGIISSTHYGLPASDVPFEFPSACDVDYRCQDYEDPGTPETANTPERRLSDDMDYIPPGVQSIRILSKLQRNMMQ